MRAIITLLSALLSFQSMAQEIAGKVIDEKREPGVGVTVKVYTGGILKGSTVTDYDGNYVIKPLEPGHYDVLVCNAGYDSVCIKNVLVSPYQRTQLNFGLTKITGQPKIITKEYRKPLIDRDDPHSLIHNDEIRQIPGCGPTDLAATSACILYQSKRGTGINLNGGRSSSSTQLVNDSVRLIPCVRSLSVMRVRNYQSDATFTREDLSRLPVSGVFDIVSLLSSTYQQRRGDEVHLFGGR